MPISRLSKSSSNQQKKQVILVTMGDIYGIGPEVILKSLALPSVRRLANFLIVGNYQHMKRLSTLFKIQVSFNVIRLWELFETKKVRFDKSSLNILDVDRDGRYPSMPLRYVDIAVSLIRQNMACGLITAPVNKERIVKSGIKFYGHTEYLATLTKAKNVAMMFISDKLKVTVVTRHIPISDVSSVLTQSKIINATVLTYNFLKRYLNIKNPKIGICALNPHAGEGALLGTDERKKIIPALKRLRQWSSNIQGPFPADSAFYLLYNGKLDSLIAMYHDQAMIPIKMLSRDKCVNVTIGLPFIRTSPAHGTAYDIARKGMANPSCMIETMRLTSHLTTI